MKRFGLNQFISSRAGSPPKKFIANGMPKSGTHLLEAVLSLHTATSRIMKKKMHVASGGLTPILRVMDELKPGKYPLCHLPYNEYVAHQLQQRGIKHILIIRNLYDVVMSQAHYMLQPQHEWNLLLPERTLNAAVRFCLFEKICHPSATFVDTCFAYSDWSNDASTLIVCYEELNDPTRAEAIIQEIFGFLEIAISNEEVRRINLQCRTPYSPTFRIASGTKQNDAIEPELVDILREKAASFRNACDDR